MQKLLLSLCLALTSPAVLSAADAPNAKWAQDGSDLKPDAKAVYGSLDNGLKYVILPNSEPPKRVSLRLHLMAGALMEDDDQQGLAHFMEHMAFNGTKNYPAKEMVEFFQRLGMAFGADTNAHTGFDETVFDMELPENSTETLDKGMLFLRDVADGMIISSQEIEEERGVIMSEKSARDSVGYRTMIEGFKFRLPDALIPKRLPIGTAEVITKAPRQRFLDFYKKWYVPTRMVVIVTGDLTADAAKKSIDKQFASLKAPSVTAPNPPMGKVTTGTGLQAKLHTEKEQGQVTITVEADRPSRQLPDNKDRRLQQVIRGLADNMLNRRLEILAKKPNSPFLAAASDSDDWLHFLESSELQITAKPENWDKALAVGEQELRRAVLHGFTKSELTEAIANFITGVENAAKQAPTRKSRDLADALSGSISARRVFVHPTDSLAWAKEILPKITVEQCHEALKKDWTTEDLRIFIGGNLTLKNASEEIVTAWKKSRSVEVAPQKEEADAVWAYTSFGAPGKVASQKTVDDLQITQVQFENGVRLNIKATDFKKDTIEFSASVGEGRLTAPKDKPGLELFTKSIFELGALGKHSIDDLKRVLAGKTVDVNFDVGEDAFVLAGKTTPGDIRLQFQLLTAFLSDPGWREDGLSQLKMALPMIYQQVNHTARGIMQSKTDAWVHGDDYRFTFPSQDELGARTIAEMKAWLEPQLKNGYLEIGIVGDLDVAEVIKAAAETIGSLPPRAKERPDTSALRNISFPKGAPEKEFAFDSKITTSTALVYWPTTDRTKDVKLSREFNLLAEILSDRVRKKVREELGESYSPNVHSIMSDTWNGYGQMFAVMTAEAKDAKKLGEIARALGAELAAKGANADELDRARKPLITSLEEQRRNNTWWLKTVVAPSQSRPERIEWIRSLMGDYTSINLDDLNKLAKEYLKPENATAVRIISTGKTVDAPAK